MGGIFGIIVYCFLVPMVQILLKFQSPDLKLPEIKLQIVTNNYEELRKGNLLSNDQLYHYSKMYLSQHDQTGWSSQELDQLTLWLVDFCKQVHVLIIELLQTKLFTRIDFKVYHYTLPISCPFILMMENMAHFSLILFLCSWLVWTVRCKFFCVSKSCLNCFWLLGQSNAFHLDQS